MVDRVRTEKLSNSSRKGGRTRLNAIMRSSTSNTMSALTVISSVMNSTDVGLQGIESDVQRQ